jgi:acyl-CoA synthetase (AMP-forming)/AMP-acid ligase II
VGELVHTGPNVMLGYAETPADLALDRAIEELRTGDIARRGSDGLYELVGRRSRFAKILGLRVDPHQVEAMLDTHGISGCCLGGHDELLVAVTGDTNAEHARRLAAGACGLPARAVRVRHLAELPRLASGKPDHQAVRDLTRPGAAPPAAPGTPCPTPPPADPRRTDPRRTRAPTTCGACTRRSSTAPRSPRTATSSASAATR